MCTLLRVDKRDNIMLNFTKIYNEYYHEMYSVAMSYLDNHEDVEEVLQDSFLKVSEHLDEFKGDSKLATWIHAIVKNKSIDFLRSKNRRLPKLSGEEIDLSQVDDSFIVNDSYITDDTPENILMREQHEQLLTDAINSLPANYKQIYTFVKLQQHNYKTTAEILNIPVGSVSSAVSRSQQLINEYLQDKELNG